MSIQDRRLNMFVLNPLPGSGLARQLSGDLGPPELGGVQHGGAREGSTGVA